MGSLEIFEKGDLLTFRSRPMLYWMFGGVAAVIMWIAGLAMPSSGWLFFAGGVAVALWASTRTAITVKFNFAARFVSVRHRNLIKYQFEVYQFDEIGDELYVRETEVVYDRNQRMKVFTLYLPMKFEEDIVLAAETNFDSQVEDAKRRINLLLEAARLKLPAIN